MKMRGKQAMQEQDDLLQHLVHALVSIERAMTGLQQTLSSDAAALAASRAQMKTDKEQGETEIQSLQDELVVARMALAESREVRHATLDRYYHMNRAPKTEELFTRKSA